MGKNTISSKSSAPALERGLIIIEMLDRNPKGLTFSEIAKKLLIPKPSLARLLQLLVEKKYLKQQERQYKLGYRLLSLGQSIQNQISLREVAKPYMEKLLKKTCATVELSIYDEGCLIWIEQLEGSEPVRIFSKVGSMFENLHAIGQGKVVLAFMTEEELKEWIRKHGLVALTEKTITDKDTLLKELDKVRKNKIGVDIEERRPGVCRIAAPIFDREGLLAGVVGMAIPVFKQEKIENLEALVRLAAAGISEELGWQKY